MTIKEFNDIIEIDYKNHGINPISDRWFPLMKYDENYGLSRSLDEIRFLSLGLNPSLTQKFAEHIHHHILKIADKCDFKKEVKFGHERFKVFYQQKEIVTNELVEYQSKLKYDPNEQISYFNHLTAFFKEIDKKISFKDHVFHYDFCQQRHTEAKEMDAVIYNNYSLFSKHLVRIIEIVKPEIIFVFNAYLAKLLRENDFFSAKEIDKNSGCYFLNGKSNTTPKIILANQLSGGATSAVYKELMVWNVQRLLNLS